ncbi:hypothetical protein CERSUDRAFT_79548 [Gelatoporia subvermispora B]|uniref:Exocyst complex component Sec3 PIP2-binding N-terminal domain-containing protein n=1 Tax=Ceriporiopsis subvermispora (strain B) TaxID=914234 RepID=M2PYH4_CERS8|nr:hypothetical protein CERSUDRAFT_79548 [Gelatoporia subvermispora B]
MTDYESVKQRILSSVFTKLNASGHDESYVAHVKIWEEASADEGGRKPRYIILSQTTSRGGGFIHKAKSNSNGTFSVGKTWKLTELRGVEVLNSSSFKITMARTYRWQTEVEADQTNFISSLVKLFRKGSGGTASLQLIGVTEPEVPSMSQPIPMRTERATTPINSTTLDTPAPRRPSVSQGSAYRNGRVDASYPAPAPAPTRSPARSRAQTPVRSESPEVSARAPAAAVSSRSRPNTPSSDRPPLPAALRPRHGRNPSNSTSNVDPSVLRPAPPAASVLPSIVFSSGSQPSIAASQTSPISIPPEPKVDAQTPSSLRTSLDVPSVSPSSWSQASSLSTYTEAPEIPQTPQTAIPSVISTELTISTKKSSSRSSSIHPSDRGQTKRDHNARVSFFDPANQATLNRLLAGDLVIHGEGEEGTEGYTGEEAIENAEAMLASVEEMLEGYEWASDDIIERRSITGTADQIEARLLDELMALEKANIHSFIESDDRINFVLKYLDDAITELDGMDSIISSYKIHLNAVSDDIAYIQSQNRGLQVQTQNQRALLDELEDLLQTVQVDKHALLALTQESLEKPASIQRLEEAATELYKALQASRDRDMAATMERLDEYRTHNVQFCKRLLDYLSIMFTAQSKLLLGDSSGIVKSTNGRPAIKDHKEMEVYLGKYSGLMLYLKEMEESIYGKLCAAYFSAASSLHSTQVKALLATCFDVMKKPVDEEIDGFSNPAPANNTFKAASSGVRRAGTIVRSPLESRRNRREQADGDMRPSDAFGLVLEQIASTIYREEDFIADFLQINDAALTFADYMGLENYFRRQAARAAGLSQQTYKLVHGAMDLIFGFLPIEIKGWLDGVLTKDHIQLIGMVACLEKFLAEAEERGNAFLISVLEKQHMRLKSLFERRVTEQIKSIEDTKLTSKKRQGVVPFIKYFPTYIGRVESQLIGADTLEIRHNVDAAYDKIVTAMFDALKQMAKLDGEGEDKGQLNYHVILIENMHHFVAEISQLELGSVAGFLKRAQSIYEENLNAYVKIVLRRPFSKIIDYFEGVERLLKTTAPSEVSSNSSYSKSSLKKVLKEYTAKDVRKHIDVLFKRVEKHFTESSEKTATEEASNVTGIAPGSALVGVWKACEEELLRITDLFTKRINQCYKDSGVILEYTPIDVEAGFRRHRIAA